MNLVYLVRVDVEHLPHKYRVINGFPLHPGDKIARVRPKSVIFFVNNWHLHEDQTKFLVSRKQQGILSYHAYPVPGPAIAKEKTREYTLIAS